MLISPLVTKHILVKLGDEHVGKYNWLLRRYENNHDSLLDSLRKGANAGVLGWNKTATKQQLIDRGQKAQNTLKRKGVEFKKKVSENMSKSQAERNGNTGDSIDWVCPFGHPKSAPYPLGNCKTLSCLECEHIEKRKILEADPHSKKRPRVKYPVHKPNTCTPFGY